MPNTAALADSFNTERAMLRKWTLTPVVICSLQIIAARAFSTRRNRKYHHEFKTKVGSDLCIKEESVSKRAILLGCPDDAKSVIKFGMASCGIDYRKLR